MEQCNSFSIIYSYHLIWRPITLPSTATYVENCLNIFFFIALVSPPLSKETLLLRSSTLYYDLDNHCSSANYAQFISNGVKHASKSEWSYRWCHFLKKVFWYRDAGVKGLDRKGLSERHGAVAGVPRERYSFWVISLSHNTLCTTVQDKVMNAGTDI